MWIQNNCFCVEQQSLLVFALVTAQLNQ
jgi:hypothetical protein